jgi:two-component system, chemotaxis family, protein-glutamate methylesterase/glutaminase
MEELANRRTERVSGRVVVIGASAGGVEALVSLVGALPADFPAPLLVVLHVSPISTSVLPEILAHAGELPTVSPRDGEVLRDGVMYIAPRGLHLTVADGRARLSESPVEHGSRPAINPLFRSAARTYGPRAVGVILSGMLRDGTAGLREVQRSGGVTIVQDPATAAFPAMPLSAIQQVDVDYVLAPRQIAEQLSAIVRRPAPAEPVRAARKSARETRADRQPRAMSTELACPVCGRDLWEKAWGPLLLYRCDAHHSFSAARLREAEEADLAGFAPQPIRALRQRGAMLERLADRAQHRGSRKAASNFHTRAASVTERADELELRTETPPKRGRDDE